MAEGKKSHKKAVIITIVCVVLVIILAIVGFTLWFTHGLSSYAKMPIKKFDFLKVPDGTYKGSFNGGRFSNTVMVTVKNHKVTDIAILKDVTFKMSKVSQLFGRVIKAQSLNVDTLTGATVTSKAFLKSVENALSGAK